MNPGEEIRLVKENLAFSVSLSDAVAAGRIPPEPLLRANPNRTRLNQQLGGSWSSETELASELSRGAANQTRAAFALSALQSQRSMAAAFDNEPIEEQWPELRAARCSLYLIGLAVQRSILQPVWECPPPYRRLFHIRRFGFTLNATGLEGRALRWDDFGGLKRYLALLDYCAASADAEVKSGDASRTLPRRPGEGQSRFDGVISAHSVNGGDKEAAHPIAPPRGYLQVASPPQDAPPPAPVVDPPSVEPPGIEREPQPAPAVGPDLLDGATEGYTAENAAEDRQEQRNREQRNGATATNDLSPGPVASSLVAGPALTNIVHRFIAERCQTGDDQRILAGELYAGFLQWCSDWGHNPISQRAFGMRLTNMGLTRKRRGHGRHWWEGINLDVS